nr:DNA lyase [Bifidobacterium sp. DSM 109958]
MLRAIGPTGWWPAETRFEIMVGAVLTQNTAWGNVARSLEALRGADALTPRALLRMDEERLRNLIRPSGFQRNKARALRDLSRWFVDRCDADPGRLAHVDDVALRGELLSLFGVGGETADDLMLYVFDRRAFVADAYARRLLAFCGWTPPRGYAAFHDAMIGPVLATSLGVPELQELHGLIDEFGKVWRDDDAKTRSPLAAWRGALSGR